MSYTSINKVFKELVTHVLPSMISRKFFNLIPGLSKNKRPQSIKTLKDLQFILDAIEKMVA